MNDNQLKEIYRDACYAKNFEPSDGQFRVWKQTLGWIERIDLEEALVEWYKNETGFPMPAELKPLAMQAKQCRENRNAQVLDYVHWKCRVCGAGMTGYIPPSDREPRTCRSPYLPLRKEKRNRSLQCNEMCGAIMNETERRMAERANH